MEGRLTQKEGGRYTADASAVTTEAGACIGAAIERLGLFEDVYEALLTEEAAAAEEMEQLRKAGRERSVRFRELMGKKLTAGDMLARFRIYGL